MTHKRPPFPPTSKASWLEFTGSSKVAEQAWIPLSVFSALPSCQPCPSLSPSKFLSALRTGLRVDLAVGRDLERLETGGKMGKEIQRRAGQRSAMTKGRSRAS